jgi:hypothetical protein
LKHIAFRVISRLATIKGLYPARAMCHKLMGLFYKLKKIVKKFSQIADNKNNFA